MNHQSLTTLFYFYGVFLIACGVISVIFIGAKAKTAVMSGGMSGLISILIAYYLSNNTTAQIAGVILSLSLFVVFSWRCAKTFFKIFELISSNHDDLKGKGIAFLIISLMAVVSMFVLILQIISF